MNYVVTIIFQKFSVNAIGTVMEIRHVLWTGRACSVDVAIRTALIPHIVDLPGWEIASVLAERQKQDGTWTTNLQ